jgi:hypothetical protein
MNTFAFVSTASASAPQMADGMVYIALLVIFGALLAIWLVNKLVDKLF